MSRRVAILTMSGAVDDLVGAFAAHDALVTVVTANGDAAATAPASGAAKVATVAVGGADLSAFGRRVRRVLWSSAAGRNLYRLTPWDGSRRLRRGIRRTQEAAAALRDADLIVAPERDTVWSAWHAVHGRRASKAEAVFGAVSAMAILDGWTHGEVPAHD